MSGGEGFATRWSRLKAARRHGQEPGEADAQDNDPSGTLPAEGRETAGPAEEAPDLPDPDNLGLDGDFSAFMRAGVSRSLRRRALRRLWSLDPVFANVDGLVEYNDDFSGSAKRAGSLRHTAHAARRLARRAVERIEQAAEEPAGAAADGTDDDRRRDDG